MAEKPNAPNLQIRNYGAPYTPNNTCPVPINKDRLSGNNRPLPTGSGPYIPTPPSTTKFLLFPPSASARGISLLKYGPSPCSNGSSSPQTSQSSYNTLHSSPQSAHRSVTPFNERRQRYQLQQRFYVSVVCIVLVFISYVFEGFAIGAAQRFASIRMQMKPHSKRENVKWLIPWVVYIVIQGGLLILCLKCGWEMRPAAKDFNRERREEGGKLMVRASCNEQNSERILLEEFREGRGNDVQQLVKTRESQDKSKGKDQEESPKDEEKLQHPGIHPAFLRWENLANRCSRGNEIKDEKNLPGVGSSSSLFCSPGNTKAKEENLIFPVSFPLEERHDEMAENPRAEAYSEWERERRRWSTGTKIAERHGLLGVEHLDICEDAELKTNSWAEAEQADLPHFTSQASLVLSVPGDGGKHDIRNNSQQPTTKPSGFGSEKSPYFTGNAYPILLTPSKRKPVASQDYGAPFIWNPSGSDGYVPLSPSGKTSANLLNRFPIRPLYPRTPSPLSTVTTVSSSPPAPISAIPRILHRTNSLPLAHQHHRSLVNLLSHKMSIRQGHGRQGRYSRASDLCTVNEMAPLRLSHDFDQTRGKGLGLEKWHICSQAAETGEPNEK